MPADPLDLDGDGDVSEPVPFDLDDLARVVDLPAADVGPAGAPPVDMGPYEGADCDGDGDLDAEQLADGSASDVNGDRVPDACQHCQADLGFMGPGSMRILVCGDDLTAADSVALFSITGAPANSAVLLAVGSSVVPTPFFGGTLAPSPVVWLGPIPADAAGEIEFVVPGSAGAPVAVVVQGVAPLGAGVLLSNAVSVVLGL